MSRKKTKPKPGSRPVPANPFAAGPAPQVPAFAAKSGSLTPVTVTMAPTPGFGDWLRAHNVTVGLTTYHTGQLILLGRTGEGALVYTARTYEKVMGIAADRRDMHLATSYQIWHLRNMVREGETLADYEAVYVPRTCHVTGALDTHDMAIESDGRLVFANTMFSCVCTVADGYSFRPLWTPPWISKLMPEDRCHLNGLGLRDGRARYVSAVARTDEKEGWRAVRVGSGVVFDIVENRPVAEGLTMPHSPRWHDGQLYYVDSGSGFLRRIDVASGATTDVCFCPGFARGLAFAGDYALVATSDQRVNRTFGDLPLEENLKRRGAAPGCALHVINVKYGVIEHEVRFGGSVREIYDVCVVPEVRRANAIGFMNDDIKAMVEIAPAG